MTIRETEITSVTSGGITVAIEVRRGAQEEVATEVIMNRRVEKKEMQIQLRKRRSLTMSLKIKTAAAKVADLPAGHLDVVTRTAMRGPVTPPEIEITVRIVAEEEEVRVEADVVTDTVRVGAAVAIATVDVIVVESGIVTAPIAEDAVAVTVETDIAPETIDATEIETETGMIAEIARGTAGKKTTKSPRKTDLKSPSKISLPRIPGFLSPRPCNSFMPSTPPMPWEELVLVALR